MLSSDPTPLDDVGPALPWIGARWHLGIDELGAPFLPRASLVVLVVLVAAPRRELGGATGPGLLFAEGTILGVYTSLDLACLAFFWVASLVPGAIGLRTSLTVRGARVDDAGPAPGPDRELRAYGVFLVLGTLPLLSAIALLVQARGAAGASSPFDLVGEPVAIDAARLRVGEHQIPASRRMASASAATTLNGRSN